MDLAKRIIKRKKLILGLWIIVFIAFVPLILNYQHFVSYSISTSALSGSESGRVQTILDNLSPQNSSLSVLVFVGNSSWQTNFLDQASASMNFREAANKSAIPYYLNSQSAFDAYASFLDSVLYNNTGLVLETYNNLFTLSKLIYAFPQNFLGNWSETNYAQSSINTVAASSETSQDNATYDATFLNFLNASYAAYPSLAPDERVQNASTTAGLALFASNTYTFVVVANLNVTNYQTELLPVTAQAISQYSGFPFPVELLKAVLAGGDPGMNFVKTYGLLDCPAFILKNYVSSDNTTMLISVNFNVSESFRSQNNTYPAQEATPTIRTLAGKYFGNYLVTGQDALAYDTQSLTSNSGFVFGFTFLFLAIAVALTLRSVLSPFLALVFVSLATGLGYVAVFVTGLALGSVDFTVTYTLTAVILGVATDYFVFILSRYREEIKNGKTLDESLEIAINKAGFAVLVSGFTVAGSLGALSFISGLRSWGPVLFISVLLVVALETILLPAVVGILGRRLFRGLGKRPSPVNYSRSFFYKTSSFSSGARKKYLVIGLILLTASPAIYFWFNVPTTYNFSEGLPKNLQSVKGLNTVTTEFGANLIYPTFVVVNFTQNAISNNGSLTSQAIDSLKADASSIFSVSGVTQVIGATANGTQVVDSTLSSNQFIFNNGKNAYFLVFTSYDPYSSQAMDVVNKLRANNAYLVGGLTSSVIDLQAYNSSAYTQLEIIILVVIAIVLLVSLRKLYYPLISLSGVFISITWTTVILYLISRYVFNEQLIFLIPIVLYVILMSLGNDFTVFILTRVKEEQSGLGAREGLLRAMVGSGTVVTSLGVILAVSLGSLAFVPYGFLQQIGIAFVISLLLDTFIIRTFYFPAMISVFQKDPNKKSAKHQT